MLLNTLPIGAYETEFTGDAGCQSRELSGDDGDEVVRRNRRSKKKVERLRGSELQRKINGERRGCELAVDG